MEEEPAHRSNRQPPSCLSQSHSQILGLDHQNVSTTSLVSTSEHPGITKRMQRLGIQRASAPNCVIGLTPDGATPRIRANLCCGFSALRFTLLALMAITQKQ